MSENEVQGQDEGIKLFGEWSFEGIEVRDIGLKRYLNVDPVYLPHTGGRHEARRFRKSNLSIVERLINNLLKPGKSGGAKGRVTNIGLARSPIARKALAAAIQASPPRLAWFTYAQMASRPKGVLSTSLRCEIHATDSM